jgi:hypothetical protein
MTNEQEKVAEQIIQLHKNKKGVLNWTTTFDDDDNPIFFKSLNIRHRYEQMELIKASLEELGLIEIINQTDDKTRLRQPGFDFTTFDKQRADKAKKEKQEKIKTFPQQYWWLVGLISYFGGLGTELIRDRYLSKKTQDTNLSIPTTLIKADTNLNHKKTFASDSFNKPTK